MPPNMGPDIDGTGYTQPHPITIGRSTAIALEQRGRIGILRVPSFPLLGRTWAVNVQVQDDALASPGVPGGGPGFYSVPWLALGLQWTEGAITLRAELDLPAAGIAFPVTCDSLELFLLNDVPTPTPANARAFTIGASVGYAMGTRATAIPRRTADYGSIPAGGTVTRPIPQGAGQVTCQKAPGGATCLIRFLSWDGTTVGGTDSERALDFDLPNGAAFAEITSTDAAPANFALTYRIQL